MTEFFVRQSYLDSANYLYQQELLRENTKLEQSEDDILVPLQEFFMHMPGSIYCKNYRGIYLYYDAQTSRIIGSDKPIGQRDHDLSWKEQADVFMENDQKVMQLGTPIIFNEEATLSCGERSICKAIKTPLLNKRGHTVGIIGNSIELIELKKYKNILEYKSKKAESSKLSNHINIHNLENMFKNNNNKFLIKSNRPGGILIFLSKRQMQCMYYLFCGYSMKEIAKALEISPRTVETHINFTKSKLCYNSRSQLVEILLENISIIV